MQCVGLEHALLNLTSMHACVRFGSGLLYSKVASFEPELRKCTSRAATLEPELQKCTLRTSLMYFKVATFAPELPALLVSQFWLVLRRELLMSELNAQQRLPHRIHN